jgi:hypothetical protein
MKKDKPHSVIIDGHSYCRVDEVETAFMQRDLLRTMAKRNNKSYAALAIKEKELRAALKHFLEAWHKYDAIDKGKISEAIRQEEVFAYAELIQSQIAANYILKKHQND